MRFISSHQKKVWYRYECYYLVSKGHTQKSKTKERIHQEEREWSKHLSPSHPYDLSRMNQIDDALNTGKDIPESVAKQKAVKMTRENIIKNANEYIKELRASGNMENLNLKLAADLERYINNMSSVKTSQEELLRKIREFNQIQKEKDMTSKKRLGSENRINQSSLMLRSGLFIGKSGIRNAKENIK